jgi:23S rRNA (uracil1939-C5)-methyltransferase
MKKKSILNFAIDHLDPMGQGVSRLLAKTNFVSKTLPGEVGEAKLIRSAKGVVFSGLESINHLTTTSPLRIPAKCPYYDQCQGCHYQHTDYANEIEFKKKSFLELHHKILGPKKINLEVIPAINPWNYRNRIQLKYNLKDQILGFAGDGKDEIVAIKECLIAHPKINLKIKELMQTDWYVHFPSVPNNGVVELYLVDENVSIAFNRPYAHLGFSQINQEMNELLKKQVQKFVSPLPANHLLDLFGGDGNLTEFLNYDSRIILDSHVSTAKKFDARTQNLPTDLFKLFDFSHFSHKKFNGLVIDPPRAGFPHLRVWLEKIRPQWMIYVACDPVTLLRDLKSLNQYSSYQFTLIDLFPRTRHYEIMATWMECESSLR